MVDWLTQIIVDIIDSLCRRWLRRGGFRKILDLASALRSLSKKKLNVCYARHDMCKNVYFLIILYKIQKNI